MAQGHHAFDHALQEANIWLKLVEKHLHCTEREAYTALRVSLQVLRDTLPFENGVKFAAQLPMLLRGIYYEGWHPASSNNRGDAEDFFLSLKELLPDRYPLDPKTVSKGFFKVLWERVDPAESAKIIDQLPTGLNQLWPSRAKR